MPLDYNQKRVFIESTACLQAQNAVAAVITTGDGRYLVQLRDNLPHIWYPAHWGCFGGGVDQGEDPETALRRELAEELELLEFKTSVLTRFDYDLKPIGLPSIYRVYFEVVIAEPTVANLVLGEGAAMDLVAADDLLVNRPVTPYDAFAIWLHYQKHRVVTPVGKAT